MLRGQGRLPGEFGELLDFVSRGFAGVQLPSQLEAGAVEPEVLCRFLGKPTFASSISSLPVFGDAARDYIAENDQFEVDSSREKFFLTFNPDGYLRKKS